MNRRRFTTAACSTVAARGEVLGYVPQVPVDWPVP